MPLKTTGKKLKDLKKEDATRVDIPVEGKGGLAFISKTIKPPADLRKYFKKMTIDDYNKIRKTKPDCRIQMIEDICGERTMVKTMERIRQIIMGDNVVSFDFKDSKYVRFTPMKKRGRPRTKQLDDKPKEKRPIGRPRKYNDIDEWRESKRIARKKAYAKKKFENIDTEVDKMKKYLSQYGFDVNISISK